MRKKAALCLLRLIRKSPPDQEIMVPDVWSVKLVSHLWYVGEKVKCGRGGGVQSS